MAVTAQMVKELRETTSAGMMDCKNALTETNGDMQAAIDLLKEKGLAKAAKKAGRVASEGLVTFSTSEDGSTSVVVEINSETDFVAKNDEFQTLVKEIGNLALNSGATSVEALLQENYLGQGTLESVMTDKIAKIGENMNIRRMEKLNAPGIVNVGYTHAGGRIVAIASFKTDAAYADIEDMGKDVAMQIAAMSPKYLDETSVDPDYIESERRILTQQALNEGKPENIVAKMVEGRLKKELKEVCLVEQPFVKNGDLNVKQYIEEKAKELGKSIEIVGMTRYEVGDGIEKKVENFAEEVAKQMNN